MDRLRRSTATGSGCDTTGRRPSKSHPKQVVHLVAHCCTRQAVAELEFDETDEQRIERTPGSQKLLGYVRERVDGRNHPGESGDLATGALGVTGGGSPRIDSVGRTHGWTKTAPVMPAAA